MPKLLLMGYGWMGIVVVQDYGPLASATRKIIDSKLRVIEPGSCVHTCHLGR